MPRGSQDIKIRLGQDVGPDIQRIIITHVDRVRRIDRGRRWARTGEQTQSGGGNRMHVVVAPLVRPAARQEAGARRGGDGGVAVQGE